jgi:hypothetical protein
VIEGGGILCCGEVRGWVALGRVWHGRPTEYLRSVPMNYEPDSLDFICPLPLSSDLMTMIGDSRK